MIPAPKDPLKNSAYRRAVLQRAATDLEFRQEVYIRCSRDFLYWCDAFAYTYDPKTFPNCPNRLFILYGYQEEGARKILKAMGIHDLLIEKSRQMGVSWLLAAIFVWLFLFRSGMSFLLGSRKEDLVDKPGDPTTLFYKLDYIIQRLPKWMQPATDRTAMHYYNLANRSTIDGESTNDNFGRGGTRTAIDLDEFPAVENGHRILRATRDATNCRLFVGTPAGASGPYFDTRTKMLANTPERVLSFHWSLNPIYAAGLYTTEDSEEGGKLTIIDREYNFPPDYKFVRDGKKRSPWYDEQCNRAASLQEIAQEIDIDYAASGWQYFDTKLIESLKRFDTGTARHPVAEGEILEDPDWKHPRWMEQKGARLKLWFTPDIDGKVSPSWTDVVCGVDTATGKGGSMSSNSVASFVRRSTGEKVAEFCSNQMSPTEFCYYVLALCKWFNNAFLIWEENGPGGEFTKRVKEEGYRQVFYREEELKFTRKKSSKAGWWSNKETKKLLLADYSLALKTGAFLNRSLEALSECSQYIMEPNGSINHTRSTSTEDPNESGENHGDRTIADALANRGMADTAKTAEEKGPPAPPPGSFGARRLVERRRKREVAMY